MFRKKWMYFVVILLLMAGISCTWFLQSNGRNDVKVITYSEFQQKLDDQESFILLIGRDDCPNCVELKDFIKRSNLGTYEFFYLRYSMDNQEVFLAEIGQIFNDINMIPYYAIINNGDIVKTGQGFENDTDFIEFLDGE